MRALRPLILFWALVGALWAQPEDQSVVIAVRRFHLPAGTDVAHFKAPFDQRVVLKFQFSHEGDKGWRFYMDQFGGNWGIRVKALSTTTWEIVPASSGMAALKIEALNSNGDVLQAHYMAQQEYQEWLGEITRAPQTRVVDTPKASERTYLEIVLDYIRDLFRRFF